MAQASLSRAAVQLGRSLGPAARPWISVCSCNRQVFVVWIWLALLAASAADSLQRDETVVLFPSLGWLGRERVTREVEIHGWVIEREDRSFLRLFKARERYKLQVIEPLLKRFPEPRFVLVGDSGERDPEVYGELARRFPKQVRRVLIRDLRGEGIEAERYRRAFAGVSNGVTVVFTDPSGIRDAAEAWTSR